MVYVVQSSLPFEVLLYLNSFYFGMLAICEFGVMFFKLIHLPYPSDTFASEMLLLIFLCITEVGRIFMGMKGNLTGSVTALIASLCLLLPSSLGILYFLLWQTYVLRLEAVLCYIQLIFQGLELVFALACLVVFYRSVGFS